MYVCSKSCQIYYCKNLLKVNLTFCECAYVLLFTILMRKTKYIFIKILIGVTNCKGKLKIEEIQNNNQLDLAIKMTEH